MTYQIRRATAADAAAIADAHVDSIRTLGPRSYPPHIVDEWGRGLTADVYIGAMDGGEMFFVAVESTGRVIGFSSYHHDGEQHRTAVYVRGDASRQRLGAALFRHAEDAARAAGARTIEIAASLVAVDFYRSQGFEETGRGQHTLRAGKRMDCVFMRKNL